MLLSVTPNPSLDLLFEAGELVWDDANRMDPPRFRSGGQGVNTVRAARELGMEALALLPLGGAIGEQLRSMLEAEGTPFRAVEVRAETRLFVGVRETHTGRSLLLNPRGRSLSRAEVDAMADAALAALDEGPSWLACCGSMLPGMPDDFYARLGAEARLRGVRFVPDCDGVPLSIAAGAGCDLLVPNAHEATRLLGRPVTWSSAGAAARALLDFGPSWAAVTLGAEGAVCAMARGAWHARPPPIEGGSAVGAGDVFLAAAIHALDEGADPPEALRRAVAAGSATLLSEGVDLVRKADVDRLEGDVEIRTLED